MGSREAAYDCYMPQTDAAIDQDWREEKGNRRDAMRSARLHQVVLERIVPRLAFLHQSVVPERAETVPSVQEIEDFGQTLVSGSPAASDAFFLRMRERGMSADNLFETLFAPAARRLGELWLEDVVDFVDVTLGVHRLQVMLETYAAPPRSLGEPLRRALLISAPEEDHLLGLDVVANFLRAAGWETTRISGRYIETGAELVADTHFAVVGVTICDTGRLAPAAQLIAAIRRASCNRAIAVMVGGRALQGRPELVVRVGGDGTAENGPAAALLAQKLYVAQMAAGGRAQGDR